MKKTLVLAITLTFTVLSLVACTGTSKDPNAGNASSVEATSASEQASTEKEAVTEATVEATSTTEDSAKEISSAESSTTEDKATEGISLKKVESGNSGENAIDSSTVDVSIGEIVGDDPVPVPTDPTVTDK